MSAIKMTPCGAVEWCSERTSRGMLCTPEGVSDEALEILFMLDPDLRLDAIGQGARHSGAAKVYRAGSYALRVVEHSGYISHSDLDWLRANLTLGVALFNSRSNKEGSGRVIRTPKYLGSIIGEAGSIFIMSFEGEGRSHPPRNSPELQEVNATCRAAVAAYSEKVGGISIALDGRNDNVLFGVEDAVKLDVEAGSGFSV
jgi:hypothetical protein